MAVADHPGVSVLDPNDAAMRSEVGDLLERAEAATGHPPMAEPSVLAWQGGRDLVGLVHRSGAAVDAYAQLGRREAAWSIEIALDPGAPEADAISRELLAASVATATERGAREIRYWSNQHSDEERGPAALGFGVERDLLQMRVALPLVVQRPVLDRRFALRAFRPGRDEQLWLEVNNRAFATHPEQGHWELETLLAREQTKWFDPDGFVLCEADGRLAGSNWTKLHADRTPPMGEIYVISVDPDFQGLGLGRVLAVAGLDRLADRVSVGMLYVDAANEGAIALYRSLGFRVDHVDRCYLLRVG